MRDFEQRNLEKVRISSSAGIVGVPEKSGAERRLEISYFCLTFSLRSVGKQESITNSRKFLKVHHKTFTSV